MLEFPSCGSQYMVGHRSPVVAQGGVPGVLVRCSSGAEKRKGCPGGKLTGEGAQSTGAWRSSLSEGQTMA